MNLWPKTKKMAEKASAALSAPTVENSAKDDSAPHAPMLAATFDLIESDIRAVKTKLAEANSEIGQEIAASREASERARNEAQILQIAVKGARRDAEHLVGELKTLAENASGISRDVSDANALAQIASQRSEIADKSAAELEAAIMRIHNVVSMIAKVARQTNLLALNATIEAERAGAMGRGFAIVASEVKSLSQETHRATDEIGALLQSLSSIAGQTIGTVRDIGQTVEDIAPLFSRIEASVQNQTQALSAASEDTAHVQHSVHEADALSDGIIGTMETLKSAMTIVDQGAAKLSRTSHDIGERLVLVLRNTEAGDRRQSDRFPVEINVSVDYRGGKCPAIARDLSEGGARLETNGGPLPSSGENVRLDINGIGVLPARIVAISGNGMLHCAFDHLNDAGKSVLLARLADIREKYQVYIERAQSIAAAIGARMEAEISSGRISMSDLFDIDYRPIAGTAPQQFETRALAALERFLPDFLEAPLSQDRSLLFTCATDRNGYIPVHNRKWSQPQKQGDVAWNTANSRNKRIFDDATGLAAGRNMRPFVIQSYKRDMGGGQFVILREIDAPIRVRGEHWGNIRTAYAN